MFVTFEGIDGSGKTTQVELLRTELERRGRRVVVTREPGGTELGERIRALLLDGPDMTSWAEATLFAAARSELVAEVIRPALDRGDVVLSDRYFDSSLAYQGIGRDLGVERVLELNLAVTDGLWPDRTFLLALPADAALARRERAPDRIEAEAGLQALVGDAYRTVAASFPDRVVEVDATRPPAEIAAEVRGHLGLA